MTLIYNCKRCGAPHDSRKGGGPVKTTAVLRKEAQEAEERLDWKTASDLWREAVAKYPLHHPRSQMAIADKAAMLQRAHNCECTANRMQEVSP